MIFKGPDIINNVGIRVKEESVIIEVQGISERYSRDETPKDSPALHIYDALLSMDKLKPIIKNSSVIISGKSESGNFKAILSDSGYITELHFDEISTSLSFKNHVKS